MQTHVVAAQDDLCDRIDEDRAGSGVAVVTRVAAVKGAGFGLEGKNGVKTVGQGLCLR